jgi:hypothetical protein
VKTIKMNNASSGKCIYYISENIVEEFHKVDSEYKDSQVLVPDKSTIIIKPPMKDMLANFLTDVMDYNTKEITTIIDTITNNYLVFRKMRQLDTNNNGRVCGDFNAFLTYRYRYCKKNIFQTHKKYENTPVVYGKYKTNNRWKCDDPVCSPTDIRVYG